MKYRYFILYKPYGVLNQFTSEGDTPTLKHLFPFPKDVYPIGRLDKDSEGLLILTNDKKLNAKLLNPGNKHERKYWVQTEGKFEEKKLKELEKGITISLKQKKHKTLPAKAKLLESEIEVAPRNPPIRFRKNIPTFWIEISLVEGKNRQVRKMTAKVGYPTLRLIRVSIENLSLDKMQPGEVIELSQKTLYNSLSIE